MVPIAKLDVVWTPHQIATLNIAILSLPPAKFFPTPYPSLSDIEPAILNYPPGDPDLNYPPGETDPAASDTAAKYLLWLEEAAHGTPESSITNFAAKTLGLLGFDERGTSILIHYPIPLTILGETGPVVWTSLSLVHVYRPLILLVLINNKINGSDAESQIIAAAIAAFQFNNEKRRDRRLNPLDAMTIPCITMTGTHPDFYLVPVTAALSNAVITGRRPATQTEVLCCPTEAIPTRRASAGMEDTRYRKVAFERFLAFKKLAKIHWAPIMEGF